MANETEAIEVTAKFIDEASAGLKAFADAVAGVAQGVVDAFSGLGESSSAATAQVSTSLTEMAATSTEELQKTAQSITSLQDVFDRLGSGFEEVKAQLDLSAATNQAAQDIQKLEAALKSGQINSQQYGQAMVALKENLAQMSGPLGTVEKALATFGTSIKGLIETGLRPLTSAIPGLGTALNTLLASVTAVTLGWIALAAAVVVATAGIIAMGVSAINAADDMNMLALRTGTAVEFLSSLKVAAATTDTDIASLGRSFKEMAASIDAAAQGNEAAIKSFERLGVSLTELQGMSPEEQFQELATALMQVSDPMERLALGSQVLGSRFQQMLPFIEEVGTKGFAKLREEAIALNQVITTDFAKAADELNDTWSKIGLVFEGLANFIGPALVDGLQAVASVILDLGKTVIEFERATSLLTTTANVLGIALRVLAEIIQILITPFQILVALLSDVSKMLGIYQGAADGASKSARELAAANGIGADKVKDMAAIMAGQAVPAMKAFNTEAEKAPPVQEKLASSTDKAAKSQEAWASAASGVAGALKDLGPAYEDIVESLEQMARQEKLEGTLKQLDQLYDANKIGAEAYARALDGLTRSANMTTAALQREAAAARAAAAAGKTGPGSGVYKVTNPETGEVTYTNVSGNVTGNQTTIKSEKSPHFAGGGVVSGSPSQAQPIIAHGGELVGQPAQMVRALSAAMGSMGGGRGGSAVTIAPGAIQISGTMIQADRDFATLTEVLAQRIEQRMRRR